MAVSKFNRRVPQPDPEDIAASYRPCSRCGSPSHAGAVCPMQVREDDRIGPVSPVRTDPDGLELLRRASELWEVQLVRRSQIAVDLGLTPEQDARLQALFDADQEEILRFQQNQAQQPDSETEIVLEADTGRMVRALQRLSESGAALAASFGMYGDTVRRAADEERRRARGRADRTCHHPHQNIRVESDWNTLSCPDCGVSVAGTTGMALTLEPCSVPVAPASDYSTGRYGQRYCHHSQAVFVQDQTGHRLSCPDCPVPMAIRPYGPTGGTLRLPVWDRMANRAADGFSVGCVVPVPPSQDGSGLGVSGRKVPDHRPGSWLSGRPWDRRESPERDAVPRRTALPGTTAVQRLAAAADRARKGVW